MRCLLLVLTGLGTLTWGCDTPPTPPAPTTTQAPQKAPPAKAEATKPLPPPAAGRRERAGIDLADGANRSNSGLPADAKQAKDRAKADIDPTPKAQIPAAEFIVTAPPAAAPEVSTGPRGSAAEAALKWVREVWGPAAIGDNADAYAALLHPDFKGRRAGQAEAATTAQWGETREPRVGTSVTWGLEEITAIPSVTGTVSIRMREAQGARPACQAATRTLTLQPATPEGGGPWRLVGEERSVTRPCPDATVRDVIGVYAGLGAAWRSRDLSAVKSSVHGGFTLLDGGVESTRYNIAALTTGPGRWVLDQLAAGQATTENTRLVGDAAIVTAAGGDRFDLRWAGGRWRLVTLWRPKR